MKPFEKLHQEMLAAGQRLIEAQNIEFELSAICDQNASPKLLETWRSASEAVDNLADDYFRAVRRCRQEAELLVPHKVPRNLVGRAVKIPA